MTNPPSLIDVTSSDVAVIFGENNMLKLLNKVYIVGGDSLIAKMFQDRKYLIVHDPANADILCFTGGADVDPSLYGELLHPRAHVDPRRDKIEKEIFDWALKNKKFMVGICRGGQFLNVMSGGEMWQDVDKHAISGTHIAYSADYGDEVWVTSTHHQMMRPNLKKCEVLLVAHESNVKQGMTPMKQIEEVKTDDHVGDELLGLDHESVYYPETGALCFQPHPEYSNAPKKCVDYFFNLVTDKITKFSEKNKKEAA